MAPLQPPPNTRQMLGPAGLVDAHWLDFYNALLAFTNDGLTGGPFITFEANDTLTAAQNLGALVSGYLFSTVTLGVATLSSSPTVPLSRVVWHPIVKAFADTGFVASAGDFVLTNATGGATTIKLPVTPTTGTMVAVKKTDVSVNAVTIDGNGANIDGAATQALAAQWNAKTAMFSGGAWFLQASV